MSSSTGSTNANANGVRFVVRAPVHVLYTIGIAQPSNTSYIHNSNSEGPCITSVRPDCPIGSLVSVGDVIEAVDNIPLGRNGEWIASSDAQERQWTIFRASGILPPMAVRSRRYYVRQVFEQPKRKKSSPSSTKKPKKRNGTARSRGPQKQLKTRPCGPPEPPEPPKPPLPDFAPLDLDQMPYAGFICARRHYYATLNNETTTKVAEKLGCPTWKDVAQEQENQFRYGCDLKGSSVFRANTYLRIPATASAFQLGKLIDQDEQELHEISVCLECGGCESPDDDDDEPMLLCDGCNVACHLHCSDQAEIPEGEWFCATCLDLLHARRQAGDGRSLVVHGPPKAPPLQLSAQVQSLVTTARQKLIPILRAERESTKTALETQQKASSQQLQQQLVTLRRNTNKAKKAHGAAKKAYETRRKKVLGDMGVAGVFAMNNETLRDPYRIDLLTAPHGRVVSLVLGEASHRHNPEAWRFASQTVASVNTNPALRPLKQTLDQAKDEHAQLTSQLRQAERRSSELPATTQDELEQLEREYAGLLEEPQLPFERAAQFRNRSEGRPKLLGFCQVTRDEDIECLSALQKNEGPGTQLIVTVPLTNDDTPNNKNNNEIVVRGQDYAIFARLKLFCPERDDELPMSNDHSQTLMRAAQRHLMELLQRDPRNSAMEIRQPQVPSSVRVRGQESRRSGGEQRGDFSACFDLSELVRDCTCDLDLPKAETPPRLAKHGLHLRDYQKSSLQWMLDKEKDKGLGFAGELWSRNRTLEGEEYYFCNLTSTFSLDIFNYAEEAAQKDSRSRERVAKHCGGLPRGGVLGDEMGLGKTVICISLLMANPPPKENRVLPREYKFDEKPTHPAYLPPPSVLGACTATSRKVLLSNGTLVVAPMTLCSQWQTEIQKFAPWLTTLTIHNEKPSTALSVEELASVDVVIASTLAVQTKKKDNHLMSKLTRIHFHRILLDESHYQQQGQKTCQGLAKLSATYRWGVTGTPIGSSLDDLHGQLRFLRIPQFTRKGFWKNAISDPYIERNAESLGVLRSLLSHVIVRHSKEQTVAGGDAMLALPPRTVTTEIIPFGSEHEQNVYTTLESRNRRRFQELRSQSVDAVLNKFVELSGMMFGARQACSHSSLVDLYRLERLNNTIQNKERRQREWENAKLSSRSKGGNAKNRASILARAVDWAPESAKNRVRRVIMKFQEGEIELMECPICLDPFSETEAAITQCGHSFCNECILGLLDNGGSSTREQRGRCATCRGDIVRGRISFLGDADDAGSFKPLPKQEAAVKDPPVETKAKVNGFSMTASDLHVTATHDSQTPRSVYRQLTDGERLDQRAYLSTLPQPFLESFEKASGSVGTKVSRLLEEIKDMTKKDRSAKAVVFSQFVGTLDCVSQEMAVRGIRFVRIDDTMKQHQRADALLDFSTDPDVKVILLSMRAGAVGLTLTSANWCFILDTPMNSAVEEQSIDRIHRIGQNRPVFVKRLVAENTVEERILTARRRLAADGPQVSTQIDGAGLMAKEERFESRPRKRARLEDEEDIAERRFEKLATLEMLFDCSSELPEVAKA